MEMSLPCDWQINKQKLLDRTQYLFETGRWSDCQFVVGQETHQQILKAHKLMLAASSPVFEAMFYGGMAEKNDPIPIKDVQPEAFKALLEYIYTDRVDLSSFELACELCYCAKKYMLPSLVKECTKYLWSDISPEKACRAYEFAKLFEEPVLMEKCLQIICTRTIEVLDEPSWEEVELGTLLTVLDQEELQIPTELALFIAVENWARAECVRKSLDHNDGKALKSVTGNALSKIRFLSLSHKEFAEGPGMSPLLDQTEAFAILMNIICSGNKIPMPKGFSTNKQSRCNPLKAPAKCSPLLSFYYEQANNAETSGGVENLSSNDNEIKIESIPKTDVSNLTANSTYALMEGCSRPGAKYCCLRSILEVSECLNTNVLDSSVTFSVDKNICVLGVQVPAQIAKASNNMNYILDGATSYTEILYAHLLDSDDTRLTYTHFTTKVNVNIRLVEIMFNRPIYIQKNKVYRVGVVFNKVGWYPIGRCSRSMYCNSVLFRFGVGGVENVRESLIRSIVFTHHGVNNV